MRLLSLFVIHFFVAAFLFSGCGRRQESALHRWPEAGAELDSLTDRLEWQFNDFAPFDSISATIVKMETLANADLENYDLKKSRSLYWKARLLHRQENHDDAFKLLREALQLNDSSTYKYDRLRILSILYMDDKFADNHSRYSLYNECLKYAKDIDDNGFEAYSAYNLGNVLINVGDYDRALDYYNMSESIYRGLGYGKTATKIEINKALSYKYQGKDYLADSIFKSLENHPDLKGDTFSLNCIPRNLYAFSKDIKYLHRAYNEIKDNPRFRSVRGLYCGLLANHNFYSFNPDSVVYYANLAKEDLPYISDYGHKSIIWYNLSLAWIVVDRLDSALMCRTRYEIYLDSMHQKQKSAEVLRLSAVHEIGAREARYEAEMFRRNMITAFIAVVLLAGGAVAALALNRRHLRQKMAAMENELKLEKTQKKMAATALAIEEKDRMLDVVKTELSDMRREGEIKEGNARRLESTIKSHLLEHESDGTFLEMIDVVNPGFTDRLRERCPDLSDSYLKLACYMLMEFDSKRIASLMMIKPESVRQSRWRLSQKLRVPEGETLEAFLRRLNKP